MNKIINAIKITTDENLEYVKFLIWTLPTLIKEGDTLIDKLNQQIHFLKGIDILTYYIPIKQK